jgi:hypothetical protein
MGSHNGNQENLDPTKSDPGYSTVSSQDIV